MRGGEAFNSQEEYLDFLRNPDYDPFGYLDGTVENLEFKRWNQTLQNSLGEEFQVIDILVPSKLNAKYIEWKLWFEHFLKYAQDDVVIIGHSLGGNFWVKYLSENLYPKQIKSLHLVAACFGNKGGFELGTSYSLQERINEIHIYHSTDDDVVLYEDAEKYARALPQAALHTFTDRGHFLEQSFPELIANIKNT